MALTLGSAHLTDEEFLEAFHGCRLESDEFRHADHLRLAWIHLHQQTLEAAIREVRDGIQKFALHHGVPGLYHETVTVAWLRLLATHREPTFETFLAENEARLSKDLLHRFWSPERLGSAAAQHGWIPPDLRPLPR